MHICRQFGTICSIWAASFAAHPADASSVDCFEAEVLLHVAGQFALYGPRSTRYEYFGFIYRVDGRVYSAVTHDFDCRRQTECVVNPALALHKIPKGAKVLGEWHTHPHFHDADQLSSEDVDGARANRHIRCYSAFYSSHDGDIYRWSPDSTSVPQAMASRTWIGSYRAVAQRRGSKLANNSTTIDAAIIAALEKRSRDALLRIRMSEMRLPGRGTAEDH